MSLPRGQARPILPGVLATQFLSSLADNALLIAAIALLEERQAPHWATPALRVCFYASYVLLAPLAGPLADAFPKGRVMLLVNVLKAAGCVALVAGVGPLLAFGAVGLGAAAYAPARYGILPELTSGQGLVRANAWMEIVTIASILGGTALGGLLVGPRFAFGGGHSQARGASAVAGLVYLLAVLAAARVRGPLAAAPLPASRPRAQLKAFRAGLAALWRDRDGRAALGVTSVFWAAAAVLQFLMIDWARRALGLPLAQAALLPAVLAIGMVAGALAAGRWIGAGSALSSLPLGLALGAGILALPLVAQVATACGLLFMNGILAGALLVPMNALLQQRGASLMRPGLSVAVQNFSENLASLALLACYGAALACHVSLNATIVGLGCMVIALVALIGWRRAPHRRLTGEN